MLSDKRIKRYLSMAKSASELSDYIHNNVGCIFVYKKDIVAVGYNHKVMGEEHVEEFLAKYDDINRGVPIGGIAETIVFLNIIEHIKEQI